MQVPSTPLVFDDGSAYERSMGRWSRIVGNHVLDWLHLEAVAHWLDVGCGTGTFTELVAQRFPDAEIHAVDPSGEQIAYARQKELAQRVQWSVANAEALPFPEAMFDVVSSALVLNFVGAQAAALAEMRRVVRHGGTVATYVWDFASNLSPSWPVRLGVEKLGLSPPPMPGAETTDLDTLRTLHEGARLEVIEAVPIDIVVSFSDFDEFWQSQNPSYAPTTKLIASLSSAGRQAAVESVRQIAPQARDGRIEYRARAYAIHARRL